jgi:hypothetical protein
MFHVSTTINYVLIYIFLVTSSLWHQKTPSPPPTTKQFHSSLSGTYPSVIIIQRLHHDDVIVYEVNQSDQLRSIRIYNNLTGEIWVNHV